MIPLYHGFLLTSVNRASLRSVDMPGSMLSFDSLLNCHGAVIVWLTARCWLPIIGVNLGEILGAFLPSSSRLPFFSLPSLPFPFPSPLLSSFSPYYPSSLPFPPLPSPENPVKRSGERCKLPYSDRDRPPDGFWCTESSKIFISGCSFVIPVYGART